MKNQLRNQVGIYLQQAEFLKKAVQKQKQQGSIFGFFSFLFFFFFFFSFFLDILFILSF